MELRVLVCSACPCSASTAGQFMCHTHHVCALNVQQQPCTSAAWHTSSIAQNVVHALFHIHATLTPFSINIFVCTEFFSAAHRLLSSGHVRRLARKLAALRAQCDDVCAVVTAGGCYAEQARIFVIPLPAHARYFKCSLVLSVA